MRIVTSYVVLLAFTAILSTFAIREVLLIRLEVRVKAALDQEMLEFDRLRTDGIDPETGQSFTSLDSLFDVYFDRNVPSNEEGMLAFNDGGLYQTSLARFPLAEIPSGVLAEWEAMARGPQDGQYTERGRFETPLGAARFRVDSIRVGEDGGAFVVTLLPTAELHEIGGLQTYGLAASIGVLALATALTWPIAGRVLAPVAALTRTARSISESNLTQRIEAHGSGEAAEMARSFNSMLDRLQDVFSSQRDFTRNASHELRDPLTICRGHLELLSDDPAERKATIALVLDELARMGRIVDDLQVLADVEHPDFVRLDWVDLGLLTHELTAKVSALAPRDWRLDAAAETSVLADRHRLTEAVTNLAHNAVNATGPGDTIAIGTAVRHRSELSHHGVGEAEWCLWVRDTGCGVPPEDREQIFDRFVRGAAARRRYQGSGLGLPIVRAIAEAHGGRVDVVSQLGVGTTFTIVVPGGLVRRSEP